MSGGKSAQSTTSEDDYYEEVIEDEDDYIEEIILEGSDVDKYDFDDDASDYTEVTLQDDDDDNDPAGDVSNGGTKKLAIVTKTPAQKAAEKELADNLALSESTHEMRESVLTKQKELQAEYNQAKEQLAREEAERARLREERELQRISQEEEEAKRRERELLDKLANMTTEERLAFEEEEGSRKKERVQMRRSSALKAQTAAEAAMRAQREALDAIERQSEEEQVKLEDEAKMLQSRIEEARKAAHVAKRKEEEEKARLKAKVNARREAAKNMLAAANSALRSKADPPPPMFQAANRRLKERDPEKEREEAARILDGVTEFYSLEQLKKQSVSGLDYKNREKYLSDGDFQTAFKCTKAEWAEMPNWKKTKAKRALGLF